MNGWNIGDIFINGYATRGTNDLYVVDRVLKNRIFARSIIHAGDGEFSVISESKVMFDHHNDKLVKIAYVDFMRFIHKSALLAYREWLNDSI